MNIYAEVVLRFAQFALKTGKLVSATNAKGRAYVAREDCARASAAALLDTPPRAIYDVTGPASVTHEELAAILSGVSGKVIQSVNVTADEVQKGLVAAGIPAFAAKSLSGLDEEAACGYQAISTPAVLNLTGRSPVSIADFLKATIPAMIQ